MSTHPDQTAEPRVAFSYIRFSDPVQANGDRLRRQVEKTADYCKRHNLALDTSTTLQDLGKSAYTKRRRSDAAQDPMATFLDPSDLVNPDRRALAGFQSLIKQRRVPRGSFLIIENLDRLSRDQVVPATHLLTGILLAGVKVVQLMPVEQVLTEESDGYQIIMAVVELSRGNGESKRKSDRLADAWEEKRRRVRAGESQKPTERMGVGCKVYTSRVPRWVRRVGGELELIPERAETIRKIFRLAAGGFGGRLIAQRLNKDGEPTFDTPRWYKQYIVTLLNDRAVLGEFQPGNKDREPEGPPVLDYFPRVISQAEFDAARGSIEQRRIRKRYTDREAKEARPYVKPDADREPRAYCVNLFQNLVFDARTGGDRNPYIVGCSTNRNGVNRSVLISSSATRGKGPAWSFPLEVFERVVLRHLREIDPAELLPGDRRGPDPVAVLEGRLAEVRANLARQVEIQAQVPTVATQQIIAGKEAEAKQLVADLEQARRKAATPLASSWSDAKSLLEVLDSAPDQRDARLRLRAALRRLIEEIRLLVIPRGRDRWAMVQIWFRGGVKCRNYLIHYRAGHANQTTCRPASWRAIGITHDNADPALVADMRTQKGVAYMLEALEKNLAPWSA
jgi:DNA invertase Pin-like site-specific DNA recombinase